MPEQKTVSRARQDARQGKSASTQAGEFVKEEMHHVREGKHGVRSSKQAVAIGLSKARRAGVHLAPPKEESSSETQKKAKRDMAKGQKRTTKKPSTRRSRAVTKALKREGHSAASPRALSRQGHASAQKRSAVSRSTSAKKTARIRSRAR